MREALAEIHEVREVLFAAHHDGEEQQQGSATTMDEEAFQRVFSAALRDAGVNLSAQAALESLKTIRHVQFRIAGQLRSGTTPGSSRARQVLKSLKLTDHRPPPAPAAAETTM